MRFIYDSFILSNYTVLSESEVKNNRKHDAEQQDRDYLQLHNNRTIELLYTNIKCLHVVQYIVTNTLRQTISSTSGVAETLWRKFLPPSLGFVFYFHLEIKKKVRFCRSTRTSCQLHIESVPSTCLVMSSSVA